MKTYSRNATKEARLSSLAFTASEKDLFVGLKLYDKLYDRVIELCVAKERMMDFHLK